MFGEVLVYISLLDEAAEEGMKNRAISTFLSLLVTPCCLSFGSDVLALRACWRGVWLLNTNGLFLFTSHKPDLGILSMRVTELLEVPLAKPIKDLICLNKNYGCKVLHHLAQDSHALPVPCSAAFDSLQHQARKATSPAGCPVAPLPCHLCLLLG